MVIAIIGIASTLIVVSFDLNDPARNTRTEAERLAELIRLAIDESIIAGSDMGLALAPDGYRFLYYEYETKNWRTPEAKDVLRPRALPETVTLELIDVDGLALPSTRANNTPRPQIVFLSSGEITPFQLSVIEKYGKEEYLITGRWDGSIIMETREHRSLSE